MRKEMEEKVFTNWTVKEMIGQGAFGKVYRIEREEFGNLYQAAMKKIVIPQSKEDIEDAINEGMDDKSVTSYFQSLVEEIVGEFRLMSQLKGHTNIVSYEDHMVIAHDDGFSWDILIRMELLKSLKNAIVENSLTQEDVIRLGIGICNALEVCGKKNIIHRDIKPENIFVTEFGEYKLGDFGIARTAEKTMSNLSKKGTYTYMAPEIYKGEAYNATVDIYSLGLVMYRLMNNNRAPFLPAYPQPISFSDREESLTKRISNAPMPAPAGGSKELQRIILKACAYSVSARYQSPAEMRGDLQKLLKDMEGANASEPLPVRVNSSADEDDTTVTVAGKNAPAKPAVDEDDTVSMFGTRTESAEETKSEPKAVPPAEPKPAASEPVIEEEAEDETVSMFTSRTESAPKTKSEPKVTPPIEPQPEPAAQKPKKKTGLYIGIGVAAALGIVGVIAASSMGGGSYYVPAPTPGDTVLTPEEEKEKDTGNEFVISSNEYLYGHYCVDGLRSYDWDSGTTFFDDMEMIKIGEKDMAVIPAEIYCFPEGSIYRTPLLGELLDEVGADRKGSTTLIKTKEVGTEGETETETGEDVFADISKGGYASRTYVQDVDDIPEAVFGAVVYTLFGDKIKEQQVHNFYEENIKGKMDTAELVFVDEFENRESKVGYYKMNGSTMEFSYLDLDEKGSLMLRPMTYEVEFSGKNLNISSDGITRTMKSYRGGGPVPEVQIYGYANSGADVCEGISYLRIDEEVDKFSIYFADGWRADGVEAEIGEGNTMTLSWGQEAKLDDSGEMRDGSGTLTFSYLDCDMLGLIIKVDGKDYFYQKTETEYYAGLVGNSVIDSGLGEEALQRMGATQMEMMETLKAAFEADGLTMDEDVSVDEKRGTITLNQDILFDADSTELSDGGKDYLARISKALDKLISDDEDEGFIDEIIVEDHTDSGGNYEDNKRLSEARALAVDNYCNEIFVHVGRIIDPVGRSSDELIYDENGNEDKAASRRVVMWITLDAEAFIDNE